MPTSFATRRPRGSQPLLVAANRDAVHAAGTERAGNTTTLYSRPRLTKNAGGREWPDADARRASLPPGKKAARGTEAPQERPDHCAGSFAAPITSPRQRCLSLAPPRFGSALALASGRPIGAAPHRWSSAWAAWRASTERRTGTEASSPSRCCSRSRRSRGHPAPLLLAGLRRKHCRRHRRRARYRRRRCGLRTAPRSSWMVSPSRQANEAVCRAPGLPVLAASPSWTSSSTSSTRRTSADHSSTSSQRTCFSPTTARVKVLDFVLRVKDAMASNARGRARVFCSARSRPGAPEPLISSR